MKPKVLIPISIQFSIRYVIRTGFLDRIRKFCDPVILLLMENKDLEAELKDSNVPYLITEPVQFSQDFTHTRNKINYWWQRKYLRSSNTAIDNYRNALIDNKSLAKRIRIIVMHAYYIIKYGWFGGIELLIKEEEEKFTSHTQILDLRNKLLELKPDAYISFAPFLQGEEIIGRLVKSMGLPMCASILSFDNLLRKNRIPIRFDKYFLWNKDMETQLLRSIPGVSIEDVSIIGAPQFDFYYDETYIWTENIWRERLGLPPDRPVILFGAGFYKIVPNEHDWLRQLDNAVEAGDIKGKPIILFRIHPNDPLDRWMPILDKAKHIVLDKPWDTGASGNLGGTNITRYDIEKLVSTLKHSHVHVNASSTMTVDGAIFDRPQIGPAYDDQPGRKYARVVKELYEREHFLPITTSGGLEIAYSKDQLIALVNAAFINPEKLSLKRKNLVSKVCTFSDGQSTNRLEKAFIMFLTDSKTKMRGLK
ncbi:MAG: CDP-glycerol glycerophosphotransferase family protein [Candidatus Marinimicrobia bacterium]|nr:CDP-glycerol glycerophosphotransferase family protein [Candidatus Neomarinimicrobiota bacterium]